MKTDLPLMKTKGDVREWLEWLELGKHKSHVFMLGAGDVSLDPTIQIEWHGGESGELDASLSIMADGYAHWHCLHLDTSEAAEEDIDLHDVDGLLRLVGLVNAAFEPPSPCPRLAPAYALADAIREQDTSVDSMRQHLRLAACIRDTVHGLTGRLLHREALEELDYIAKHAGLPRLKMSGAIALFSALQPHRGTLKHWLTFYARTKQFLTRAYGFSSNQASAILVSLIV